MEYDLTHEEEDFLLEEAREFARDYERGEYN